MTASLDNVLDQLKHIRPPIEKAPTLPPACYSEPLVQSYESVAVFRRSWLGLGRSSRWPEAGDYSAIDIAAVPTIVMRAANGELCAYANSCRHRGMKLLEGEGNVKMIRCPFHAWVYRQDGSLASAPTMHKTCDFRRVEHNLHAFRVAERDGFAFICMDESAPEIDQWLGDFSSLHAEWSLADLRSARRTEYEVRCNWKAFVEVFNEYYHLPTVHPDSINPMYDTPDDCDRVTGHYTTQFGTTQGTPALLDDDKHQRLTPIQTLAGRNLKGTRYTWVYPNLTFAASVESLWMFEVFPLAPDRTRVGMTICFAPQAFDLADFETRAQAYYARFDTAISEDLPILEQQQIGLSSPFAKAGRFSHLEPSVANFACWYAAKMGAQQDAGIFGFSV